MAPSVRSPVIHNLVEMHMYLMAFAWLIAAPIAIAIAIYGRFFKVKWWVKAHMLIMGFGVGLPFSVAAIAGMVASHGFKPRPHMVLGAIITFLAWGQIALGVTNHIIFRLSKKRRTRRPWHNSLHLWLGRFVTVLSIINVLLGIQMRHLPYGVFIAYCAWLAFLIFGFTALYWCVLTRQQILQQKAVATSEAPSSSSAAAAATADVDETVKSTEEKK
ncbi:hypothetical protein VTP01DRAFT_6434 [Rhizomucor pusillus]|uniref:uncharacterized protein n=1 Tax=Rhizomucor pusillus TaxID=4840 RepID=UPI0037421AA1